MHQKEIWSKYSKYYAETIRVFQETQNGNARAENRRSRQRYARGFLVRRVGERESGCISERAVAGGYGKRRKGSSFVKTKPKSEKGGKSDPSSRFP